MKNEKTIMRPKGGDIEGFEFIGGGSGDISESFYGFIFAEVDGI